MTERQLTPTLTTLFDALSRRGDDPMDDAVIIAFAECVARRGGSSLAISVSAMLLRRFTVAEISGGYEGEDRGGLHDLLSMLADAIAVGNRGRSTLMSKALADTLRWRALLQDEIAFCDTEIRRDVNGDPPSHVRAVGLDVLRDLAVRARRGILQIDAALFTALTGISVHVIGDTIAEPFSPADLYAVGFPEPLPPPPPDADADASAPA